MFWNSTETETAGPQRAERPHWLKNDTENPSGKDWDTAAPSVSSEPTMGLSPTSLSGSTTDKDSKTRGTWCKRLSIVGFSLLLLAAFIYSAITQNNDGDAIEWYIFYSFSAAVPAFFLCHYMICFPVKPIYLFTAGMACWSTVYIVLVALKLADTPKGEPGDDEGQSTREELKFELAGVSVGLFSALYHACASRCFVNAQGGKAVEQSTPTLGY